MSGGDRPTKREGNVPTREEFFAARSRELARHNLRLSRMTGRDVLAPEDRKLLSGDTPADEVRDQETVKRWSAARGPNRR
jgi:hypothetical protein